MKQAFLFSVLIVAGCESAMSADEWVLVLDVAGSGRGMIAASPAADFYANGAQVTVTATPANGSIFTGWQGEACRAQFSNPCSVIMNTRQFVTAIFHTLTLTATGSGSGSFNATSSGIGAAGANISVTPVPASGSVFTGWRGDACKEAVFTCTFRMMFATTATGVFVPASGVRQYDGEYAGTHPSPAGPTPFEFVVSNGVVSGRWVGPPGTFTGTVSASGAFAARVGPLDGGCTVDLTGQLTTALSNGITAMNASGAYKKNTTLTCDNNPPFTGGWSASRNLVQTKSFFGRPREARP